MNVINFIINYYDIIIAVVAIVAGIVFAIFKGNKGIVMKMLECLVTEAEKEYGSGTGVIKLTSVIEKIYPKLPAIIKTFITSETLVRWIEVALETAKEKWNTNVNLKKDDFICISWYKNI